MAGGGRYSGTTRGTPHRSFGQFTEKGASAKVPHSVGNLESRIWSRDNSTLRIALSGGFELLYTSSKKVTPNMVSVDERGHYGDGDGTSDCDTARDIDDSGEAGNRERIARETAEEVA